MDVEGFLQLLIVAQSLLVRSLPFLVVAIQRFTRHLTLSAVSVQYPQRQGDQYGSDETEHQPADVKK